MRFFIQKYNQEIVLLLFCIGLFCYGLGLKGQTFLHVGIMLFIIFQFRIFRAKDFKPLLPFTFIFFLVLCLGIWTMFDTLLSIDNSKVLKSINTHIVNPFVMFVIGFCFALYALKRYSAILFYFFVLMCLVVAIESAIIYIQSGKTHQEPFKFFHIIALNLWLFGASAFCLNVLFLSKKIPYKFLGFIGLSICFVAIVSNGERSFLLGFVALIFASFFIWQYQYKKIILLCVIILSIPAIWGALEYSKTLSPRYNFAHMLENIYLVWQVKPIEMGQFDEGCFAGWLPCATQSMEKGKHEVSIEHSALARIALYKSALHLIANEPFVPHIVGSTNVGTYLRAYYQKDNPYRIYLEKSMYDRSDSLYGYNHVHSTFLSLCIEYGLVGFGAILLFWLLIFRLAFVASYNKTITQHYRFAAYSVMIFLIALFVQAQFDVFYSVTLQPLLFMAGLFVGYYSREVCNAKTKENSSNNQ